MISFKFDNDNHNDIDIDNDSLKIGEINNTFGFNRNSIVEKSHHLNTNKDNNAEKNQNTNKNIFQINHESSTGLTYKNKEILPEFYPINIILEKVSNDKIKNKLKVAELEKTYEYNYMESLNKIYKKYQKEYDYNYFKNENKEKEKRGRKRKSDRPIIEHNRMTADNIIKKIKIIVMKNIIDFLNQLLKETTKNAKLYRLAYKYSNQLNRAVEFKFLRMKLKELVSLDISPKYIKVKKCYNSEIITKIIKKRRKFNR